MYIVHVNMANILSSENFPLYGISQENYLRFSINSSIATVCEKWRTSLIILTWYSLEKQVSHCPHTDYIPAYLIVIMCSC